MGGGKVVIGGMGGGREDTVRSRDMGIKSEGCREFKRG
jgi:hypothetical protein